MSTKHKRRTKYLAFTLAPALLIIMMMLVPALAMAQTGAICTDCHNATTLITGKVAQWEVSVHGTGIAYLRGTAAGCAGCHSGGGFSAMVAAGQEPNTVTVGDPNPTRQDCRACHQIHTTYTGTDWALETIAPVNLFALPGKTFDGGKGNLCAKCHQPRTAAPVAVNGMVTGISSHWGPHHGPQSAMMLGTGGAGAEGTPSAHYTNVEDTCVTCHLGSTDNHTFEPSVATCKVCHTTATNFDINGVQTETQAKLDQLGNLLVALGVLSSIDPAEGVPTVTSAQENVAYALYNWVYIAKEDKSLGVHNAAYTEYLLDASIAGLNRAITAFTIPGQIGGTTIDQSAHTIALTMPYGTDVTALVPTITITGASVAPASGAANDFTSPSTYTVTAADASTQDYTVTVTVYPTPPRNYYWTWYDNVGGDDWILLANPISASRSLAFDLSIGGSPMALSAYNNGLVAPGASITPIYSGVMNGPVKATSMTGDKAIVSQRILWPKGGNSLEEVPGTDAEKLSNHFYWTWYDDLSTGYTNYVMVANPGTSTVYYRIKIAGANQSAGSSGSILAGQSAFWRDGTKQGGPVEVEAWSDSVDGSTPANVLASQRVLSNGGSAFNEVPGIPASELSDRYEWTWYDNRSPGATDWIMISNQNASADMYYDISIGGNIVQNDTSGGPIAPGHNITPVFSAPAVPAATGPVEVRTYSDAAHTTSMNSVASQRVIWGPSFEEVPGYPYSALSNTYHWTWYDQSAAGVYNWVMVSKQDFTSTTVWYKVLVGGEEKKACTQIPAEGRDTPAFPGEMGGPVEVRSYSDSGCNTPSAPGNGIMASQRVLWKGYFNEVVGTVLD